MDWLALFHGRKYHTSHPNTVNGDSGTVSLVKWHNMDHVLESTADWTWNCIDEYYGGIEPDTNVAWGVTSNWPIHAILQWANKLERIQNISALPPSDYVTDEAVFLIGLVVQPQCKQWNP